MASESTRGGCYCPGLRWTRGPALGVAALALAAAELIPHAEARGKRANRPATPSSIDPATGDSMWAALSILGLLFVLCGGGIGWCLYLEYAPTTKRTRQVMYCVLLGSAVLELGCCARGVFATWMAPVVLFIDLWGPVDAVLRFPVLHGFDTVFTIKQLLLVIVKAISYILGLVDFSSNKVPFFALLMVQVIALPLMYVLALPLDEAIAETPADTRGVVDVDILRRLARIARDPRERRECVLECRRRARVAGVAAARSSPGTAGALLSRLDPGIQRAMQKSGREI